MAMAMVTALHGELTFEPSKHRKVEISKAWHLGEPSDSGTSWSTDPWQIHLYSALSYGKRMETGRIAPVQTHHHHLEMDLHKIFRMQTEQVSVKAVNTILLLMRVGAWYSTRKIKITFQAKVQCAENRSSIPSIPMEASNTFMLGKSSWLDLKLKKLFLWPRNRPTWKSHWLTVDFWKAGAYGRKETSSFSAQIPAIRE